MMSMMMQMAQEVRAVMAAAAAAAVLKIATGTNAVLISAQILRRLISLAEAEFARTVAFDV